MTTVGLLYLIAIALGLTFFGPRSLVWLAATAVPLYDSAAVIVVGVGVSPFYVVLAALLTVGWRTPPTVLPMAPRRAVLMWAFWGVCVAVTLVGPVFFAGRLVVASGLGLDEQVGALTPLAFSLSNLAQIGYLSLNLLIVLPLRRFAVDGSRFMLVVFLTGVSLAVSDLLTTAIGAQWPHELFDNSPRNFYADGDVRLRGPMAEPSHLGIFALAAVFFFLTSATLSRSPRQLAVRLMLFACSLWVMLATASGTALGGAALMIPIVLIGLVWRITQSRSVRIPASVFMAGLSGAVVTLLALPQVWEYASGVLESKQGSTSQLTRGYVDRIGYQILEETWGLGVGLGSNRSSSLAALLVSSVGIVGTILFVCIVASSISHLMRDAHLVPVAASLASYLAAAVVSSASFSSPVLWCLLSIGLAGVFSPLSQSVTPTPGPVRSMNNDLGPD